MFLSFSFVLDVTCIEYLAARTSDMNYQYTNYRVCLILASHKSSLISVATISNATERYQLWMRPFKGSLLKLGSTVRRRYAMRAKLFKFVVILSENSNMNLTNDIGKSG